MKRYLSYNRYIETLVKNPHVTSDSTVGHLHMQIWKAKYIY